MVASRLRYHRDCIVVGCPLGPCHNVHLRHGPVAIPDSRSFDGANLRAFADRDYRLDNRGCPLALGRERDQMTKKESRQQVYTLLVEVGRNADDGLPAEATGAALMCYASGIDEAEAVRETVAILKQADLAPLDVSGYGTLDERIAEGHDIPEEEITLMERALDENSVIVAQMTHFFDKID
jgi:hypothetical protein